MIEQYFLHNRFWKNLDEYFQNDPHLLALRGLKHVHPLSWWQEIDWEKPGIYLLAGGR
ncbi:MAG: hypothetical protein HYU99_05910 [Deltaproteobacteria bacterium]|nr:hypothetical protein [Deltaproteobacteria bacterium]